MESVIPFSPLKARRLSYQWEATRDDERCDGAAGFRSLP